MLWFHLKGFSLEVVLSTTNGDTVMFGPLENISGVLIPSTSRYSEYKYRKWYRSGVKGRHPDAPLPYTMRGSQLLRGTSYTSASAPNSFAAHMAGDGAGMTAWPQIGVLDNGVSNRARARFVANVKDKSSAALAVTLAEWSQSEKMIVERATTIRHAWSAVRRRDPAGLAKALGFEPNTSQKKLIRNSKDASKTFLEFHFGWAPLMGDIRDGIKVFGVDPPMGWTYASARASILDHFDDASAFGWRRFGLYESGCAVRAHVHIDNPNVALLNQLGLADPLGVAWELVPWSFLVDWFTNVGELLGSFTDLLGYAVAKPSTTTLKTASISEFSKVTPSQSVVAKGVGVIRTLGLPSVHLILPQMPERFSPVRAATAVALLVQAL